MRRRDFPIGLGLAERILWSAEARGALLLLSADDAHTIKTSIAGKESAELRRLADQAARSGPWSVTFHRPPALSLPPNEYFSQGPYWWPDPNNPSGPYIRRDGERNPQRFDNNHHDLGTMSMAVLALGIGAYFLDDSRYAEHAAKVLSTWFTDPKTGMKPNLEHAQAIPGRNNGRGTGIIDTVPLIYAAQGIVLLEGAGRLESSLSTGLHRWYANYLHWMLTSKNGLDEMRAPNNHGTWWAAQAAAYAMFRGEEATLRMVWDRYRRVLVT
ncbi:MAG TPA: alginate lyase family protein [Bryobacteraceae bacterium]|nr:alginate lyase family protein [Bryobacteraceae bacterium]